MWLQVKGKTLLAAFLCSTFAASNLKPNSIRELTIQAQNRKLIGELYLQIKPEIFAIFRQACIAEDKCEDMVHDVFMKLLGIDLILERQLKALAVTIAYQLRTDYFRHRAYVNKVRNDSLWRIEQSYTNTEAEMNDILNTEMKVIHCMSDKDAMVYRMLRFDDKTTDEIAIETGLSKRAVESRIYRTRSMVRERVREVINF